MKQWYWKCRQIPFSLCDFPNLCPRDRRLILSFCPPLWNLNLDNNFWTVSTRALIFHLSIPCDKTFPGVPLFFTLRPWPWSLTHFFKDLTLLITFQQWVLELIYLTGVFLVIWPLFFTLWPWPSSLTHFLGNFNLAYNFWTVRARTLIFHMRIPCDKTFPWLSLFFLPCDLDLGVWPIF